MKSLCAPWKKTGWPFYGGGVPQCQDAVDFGRSGPPGFWIPGSTLTTPRKVSSGPPLLPMLPQDPPWDNNQCWTAKSNLSSRHIRVMTGNQALDPSSHQREWVHTLACTTTVTWTLALKCALIGNIFLGPTLYYIQVLCPSRRMIRQAWKCNIRSSARELIRLIRELEQKKIRLIIRYSTVVR